MNSSAHLPVSESAARQVRHSKTRRKSKAKGKTAAVAPNRAQVAAAGSLTRTKALLLAALRVWELKHRVRD
jgi:hypothetical protein